MLSVLLFLAVIAIGVIGFYLGREYGKVQGFNRGYVKGHREGQKKWQQAMEARRGPDGVDQLVRVVKPALSTSHAPRDGKLWR